MELGIFAKTFDRSSVRGCLAAVADAGISAVQFNFSLAGLDTVPSRIPPRVISAVRAAAEAYDLTLAAVSGTFNAAHPEPTYRAEYVRRFPVLAAAAAELGIPVVTLSSGSRDPAGLWRHHPDNDTDAAWSDARQTLTALAAIAADQGIVVAFEPEHANVVSTAARGVRMLAEVGSPQLGVVFDAANLITRPDAPAVEIESTIAEAIDALGPRIVLAHAKELTADRAAVPAGAGVLPWAFIAARLEAAGFSGALVIHGLREIDVPRAVDTLRGALDAAGPKA